MFQNKLSVALIVICSVLLLADFFYDKHAKYPLEKLFGSYALAGLLGSVAIVLMARVVASAIRRGEDYYDR